jgi:hypothetical protein
MVATWTTTEFSRLINGQHDGKRKHVAYTAVTPDDIVPKLAHAGYRVRVRQGSFTGAGQAIVSCTQDGLARGGYAGECHILLDHQGRASVKLRGGVLRLECANQFYQPAIRLHHCGEEIREFLANPASFVQRVIMESGEWADRVESLRGVGNAWWLLDEFRKARPRLAKQAGKATYQYYRRDFRTPRRTPDAWHLVQGMTAAVDGKGERIPSLCEAAARIVALPKPALMKCAPLPSDLWTAGAWN